MLNEYTISAEALHPDHPRVKLIACHYLIETLMLQFPSLQYVITAQHRKTEGAASVMFLVGDYVLVYMELKNSRDERMVYFLPLNLNRYDFVRIFGGGEELISPYCSLVNVAKYHPQPSRLRLNFLLPPSN